MEFSEIVGVVVLLLALLLPLAKRALERRSQHKDPEGYRRAKEEAQKHQAEQMVRLRQAMGYRQHVPEPDFENEEEVIEIQKPTGISDHPLPVLVTGREPVLQRSRAGTLLDRLNDRGEIVVLHEIFSDPVVLRR